MASELERFCHIDESVQLGRAPETFVHMLPKDENDCCYLPTSQGGCKD